METISVNIISQDEEETLPYTLHCIEVVLMPYLKEVVVVDGGSEDNTLAVVESYRERLPIVLLQHPFDAPGPQKNRGLDLCTGDWVMGFDADNAITSNFSALFAAGAFQGKSVWDFMCHELAIDEYHIDPAFPVGPTTRFWRNKYRYGQVWHEQLKYDPGEKGICGTVAVLEHCLLQTRAALLHRGERWQRHISEMIKYGPSAGTARRYLDGEWVARSKAILLPDNYRGYVVPRDTDLLREIDRRRNEDSSCGAPR